MMLSTLAPFAGVLTILCLLTAPTSGHRDGESGTISSSRSGSTVRAHEDARMERHSLDLDTELLDKECKVIAAPTLAGIEALKKCVTALEDYATKVRNHENEAFNSHGKYRRAFIQTYALLKSVLGPNNQLHRFRATFVRNHTAAGQYLQKELAKVQSTVDTIGEKVPGAAAEARLLQSSSDNMQGSHLRNVEAAEPDVAEADAAEADASEAEATETETDEDSNSAVESAADGHFRRAEADESSGDSSDE